MKIKFEVAGSFCSTLQAQADALPVTIDSSSHECQSTALGVIQMPRMRLGSVVVNVLCRQLAWRVGILVSDGEELVSAADAEAGADLQSQCIWRSRPAP